MSVQPTTEVSAETVLGVVRQQLADAQAIGAFWQARAVELEQQLARALTPPEPAPEAAPAG